MRTPRGRYGCAGAASLPRPQPGKCYLKKGKGAKSRVVGISEVDDQLERQVVDGIPKQEVCKALFGLHALTGCDTVSAFAAKGKWRPLQMIAKNQTFVETM